MDGSFRAPDRISAGQLLARFFLERMKDAIASFGLDLCCRPSDDEDKGGGGGLLKRALPGQAAWNHATVEQVLTSIKNHPHDNEQIEIACRAIIWKTKHGPAPRDAVLELLHHDGCKRLLAVLDSSDVLRPPALIACFNAIESMCAAGAESVCAFATIGAAHSVLRLLKARTDHHELVEHGMRVLAAVAAFGSGTLFAGSVRALVDVMCASLDNARAMATAFRILYTLVGLSPATILPTCIEEGADAVACGVVCASYKYQSGMLARIVSGAFAEASAEAITLLGHMYDRADDARRRGLRASMAQYGFLAALANIAATPTTDTGVAIQALALLCLACEGSSENIQLARSQGAAEPLSQLVGSSWDSRVQQLARTSLGFISPSSPHLQHATRPPEAPLTRPAPAPAPPAGPSSPPRPAPAPAPPVPSSYPDRRLAAPDPVLGRLLNSVPLNPPPGTSPGPSGSGPGLFSSPIHHSYDAGGMGPPLLSPRRFSAQSYGAAAPSIFNSVGSAQRQASALARDSSHGAPGGLGLGRRLSGSSGPFPQTALQHCLR
eukprot:tig00021493_g21896.t1